MVDMTANEKGWFNKLYRLLSSMPSNVEIQVHNGSIQMNRKGAREASIELNGHSDSAESLDSFVTHQMRVYPCSESV